MPLQLAELTGKMEKTINRRIAALVKQKILMSVTSSDYQIDKLIPVQLLPKTSGGRFSFGKPEGLRVFIRDGKKMVAAVDFMYTGKTLRLSFIYEGPKLDQLVRTLDDITKMLKKTASTYHAEVISFLYSQSVFILVKSGRSKMFFQNLNGVTRELSLQEFKSEINAITDDQPKPEEFF